jgi:hypothetical protein
VLAIKIAKQQLAEMTLERNKWRHDAQLLAIREMGTETTKEAL